MALLFADNSTNDVNFGSAASLDNVSNEGTIIFWGYWPSVANAVRAICSITGGTNSIICFRRAGDGTSVRWQVQRSGANATIDSDTGTLTANVWLCVCLRWKLDVAHTVFVGTQTQPLVSKVTSPTLGSGTHDHSAGSLTWGEYASNVTQSDNVYVARLAVYNHHHSDHDVRRWQSENLILPGTVLDVDLGVYGTGNQYDRSGYGNHGTVTGATQAPHPPFLRTRRRFDPPWIEEAAAPAGHPAMRRFALAGGIYRPTEIGREGVLVA